MTKTNELGYTLPFAEVLVSQGHAVIHISKQNAFEQGKDLISIDPSGRVYGYQLKGANITDHRWFREVKPEIDKLRDLPIIHPSIPAGTRHTSVLVTNGMIDDTVRRAITDMNNGPWKRAKLQTIVRGQLVRQFVDASAAFVPQQLDDYRAFLDLFFADGSGFIDDEKLSALFEHVLDLHTRNVTPIARKRNIAAAILYGSYAMSSAASAQNHVACLHALARLTGYVFAAVERYALPKALWSDSIKLLLDTIATHAQQLETEMLNGGYDNLCRDIWDGSIAIFRRQAAFDALVAFKLFQLLRRDDQWRSIDLQQLLPWNIKGQVLWGESAVLALVLRFLLFHALAPGDARPFDLLSGPLNALADANGPDFNPQALLSPYFNLDTAVQYVTDTLPEPINESFRGHSYTIGSLIDLLARYDQRQTLEALWRRITYVAHVEYQPARKWEYFRRRGASGREVSLYPKQTQSWAELKQGAAQVVPRDIPKMLLTHPEFLPFFLLAYPHHVGRNLVRHLDDVVTQALAVPTKPARPRRRRSTSKPSGRKSASSARPKRRSAGTKRRK